MAREKNNLIVKHNDLIEARYDLNLIEQKIILYSVTKIDTSKENFNIIHIKVNELTELMESKSMIRYSEFRMIANGLMDRKVALKDRPNLDIRWVASSEYVGDGIIELEFSSKLIPYLLQLKNKFTRYQLKNILNLKNKYSIRIYELMKQYERIGKRQFELEEFKEILMIENQYDRVYDLERFILKPAEKEINSYTDIEVSYDKIKQGKKVIGLSFTIDTKAQDKEYIEYLNQQYNIQEIKEKMGIDKEKFNSKQVMDLYEIAVQKTENESIDVFEYVRLNYLNMIEKKTVRNKYSYLVKSLEEDYAKAVAQLNILNKFNEVAVGLE